MAKQLNVDMRFRADTSQARKAIDDLNASLSKLAYGSMPQNSGINPATFEAAAKSARELTYHLNQAFNTKTGNLDLSKLDASLKSSGTNLAKLTANFAGAGEAGQQAFVALAKSIAAADQPVLGINSHLATLWTTLKNVARFQISSSIIHGLVGGLQSAYGYAKDLNQSLNNIRIVTGDSTEKMARFAREANNAAKAFSSTTLDYTNASLIYYQQGLDDAAVRARTDVTVKLANVSRQSAEEVSNQMTAIWENFDNGAHSMEYFADVITALGATTASSSEEIATGLEKFAPIAGTIGLSYEKATAALAAIIANTRQSADTVGTGLRTIFSRFEALQLGETLEDGVDLNKYTKAMQTIGVNVLDANGKLKDMDTILDDIAQNWQKLDNTQKTAFATTVGGVRQYTNLMALFEGWDDVQRNMMTASGAEGTLQKQADIYAESWEAASKRVKTATQGLYDTLINDKAFIGLNNRLSEIIEGVDKFAQAFGGARGIIVAALSLIGSTMADKVGPALQKLITNITILTGGANKVYQKFNDDFTKLINERTNSDFSVSSKAELQGAAALSLAKTKYAQIVDKLSTQEKLAAELDLSMLESRIKQTNELAKEEEQLTEQLKRQKEAIEANYEAAQRTRSNSATELSGATYTSAANSVNKAFKNIDIDTLGFDANTVEYLRNEIIRFSQEFKNSIAQAMEEGVASPNVQSSLSNFITGITNQLNQIPVNINDTNLQYYKEQLRLITSGLEGIENISPGIANAINKALNTQMPNTFNDAIMEIQANLLSLSEEGINPAVINLDALQNTLKSLKLPQSLITEYINARRAIDSYNQATDETGNIINGADKNTKQYIEDQKHLEEVSNRVKATLQGVNTEAATLNFTHTIQPIEALTVAASSFGLFATQLRSFETIFDSFSSGNLVSGITQFTMGLSLLAPSILHTYTNLGKLLTFINQYGPAGKAAAEATTAAATAQDLYTAAQSRYNIIANNGYSLSQSLLKAVQTGTKTDIAAALVKDGLADATEAEVIAEELLSKTKGKRTAEDIRSTLQTILETRAKEKQTAATEAQAAAEEKLALVKKASKPILLAVTAAIIIATAAFAAHKKAVEEARQSSIDYAEATQKIADNNKTEADANEDLIKSYEDAKKAWEDGTGSKEDLVEAANKAIDAYGLETRLVDIATDSYDKLTEAIKRASKAQDEETIKSYERARRAQAVALANEMQGTKNGKVKSAGSQGVSYQFKGTDASNSYIYEAIENLQAAGELTNVKWENNKLIGSAEEIYNALQKITDKAYNLAENQGVALDKTNKAYINSVKFLEEFSDRYETLIEDTKALQNSFIASELNLIKPEDIDSVDKFNKKIDELVEKLIQLAAFGNLTQEELREMILKMFSKEGYTNEVVLENKLQEINEKANVKDVNTWYNTLNDDLKPLVLQLDISSSDTEDSLLQQLEYLQALTKKNSIQLNIDAAQEGQNLAKAGKTSIEEWKEWAEKNLNENFYDEMDISPQRFFLMDDDEKQEVLTQWEELQRSLYSVDESTLENQSTILTQHILDRKNRVEALQRANSGQQYIIEAKQRAAYNSYNSYHRLGNNQISSLLDYTDTVDMVAEYYQKVANGINDDELFDSILTKVGLTREAGSEWIDSYLRNNFIIDDATNKEIIEKNNQEISILQAEIAAEQDRINNLKDSLNLAQTEETDWAIDVASEAEASGISLDSLRNYAQYLQETTPELKDAEEQAYKLALSILQTEQSSNAAGEAITTYRECLAKGDKTSSEFADSLMILRKNLSNIFEVPDLFTEEWLNENQEIVDKLFNGTKEEAAEAFKQISQSGLNQYFSENDDITDVTGKKITGLDEDDVWADGTVYYPIEFKESEVSSLKDTIEGLINNLDPEDLAIHPTINEINGVEDYIHSLGVIAAQSEEMQGQVTEALNAAGFDVQYVTKTISAEDYATMTANNALEIDGQTIPIDMVAYTGSESGGTVTYPIVTARANATNKPPSNGGGGSKSSAKKHKTKKADSGTRYHTVKEKQSDNSRKAQQSQQAAERAFGQTRIDNLKQQIELQKESVDLQRQYIDEINNYLAGDRNKMQDFFANNFNIKFSFDENGVIENYQEIEDKLLNWYNNNANKELTDEQWEKVEEQYEQAKEYLSMYEETLNLSEEQLAELTNKLNELADLYLKLTQEQVEMRIDVSDDQLKMLEYQLEKIEDDAYKTAEAIALLGDQTQNTLDRVSIYENGLDDLLRHHGVTLEELQNMDYAQLIDKGFTDEEIQQMRDWVEQVLDANKQLLEMRTNVIDKVIDGLDALNDKVSESYDLFSHYNDVLEDYRNITDLLGGRIGNAQSNAIVNSLNRVALQNAENTIASARNNYEALQRMQADALEHYNEAVGLGNTGAAEEWERVLIDVQEKLNDAQSEFLQTWQDGLDAAQKALEDAVDASVESYEKGLAPLFGSLESLRDAYDKQKEVDELYLQDYDRLYELSKLNRDLQAAIDDTSNIKGKQRLRDLQAEINKLQADGNKLSEYDVEVLRKRFELEQARQAVEDARNAKSQVRLRRDSEGNWGYVYTASEDEVAKAQQAYEDKLHEYQELNDEYITELQEKALDVQSDYAEQFAEIMKDTTLNDEQRAERLKSLNNWFTNEMAAFDDQMNNALENQASTLERYYKAYGDLRAELIDQFDETRLSSLTNKDNVMAYMENVMNNYNTLNEQGQAVITQYEEDVNRILAAAGSSLDIYSDQVAQAMINIGTQSDATKDKVFELSTQMEQSFGESLDAALSWEEEYGRLIDEAIKHNEDFLHSIYEMIAALTMLGSQDSKYLEALQAYQSAEMTHRDFVSKNGDKEDSAWESAQTAWRNYISDWMASWSSTPTRFYTGGYTGNWGSDGRLAVLDQKELVLNREDTANFLAAADILRTLDMNANILSNGLGSIYNPFFGGIGSQTLDQNVHIVAEFPNVQDRNEIEAAFESLVNRASQYANRKS